MNDATAALSRIDQGSLAPEPMPSFADVPEETGGGWPCGWYRAEILGGYATFKGKQMTTSDTASQDGNSRNTLICLKLTALKNLSDNYGTAKAGETRNYFYRLNYRLDYLSQASVERVKAKDESVGTHMRLSIARLGEIERALGFGFERHPQGHINPTRIIGQHVDVRLGFNKKDDRVEVNKFAQLGSHT